MSGSAQWKAGELAAARERAVGSVMSDRQRALLAHPAFHKLADLAARKASRASKLYPDGRLIKDEEANARVWMAELSRLGYSVGEVKLGILSFEL